MYTDYEHLYYNSLCHSGVKGMKLGVRKRAAEYKNKMPKAVKDLHIERIAQMALPPAR